MTVARILKKVDKICSSFPAKWVCLTGGEPLIQNIGELVRSLKAEDFKIQVETNATIFRSLAVNWYTISPKPPLYFYQPEFRTKAKEVKIVVTKRLNLRVLKKLRQDFPEKIPLLLQPQSCKKWSTTYAIKVLNQAMKDDLKNIRLTAQMHKIFGLR